MIWSISISSVFRNGTIDYLIPVVRDGVSEIRAAKDLKRDAASMRNGYSDTSVSQFNFSWGKCYDNCIMDAFFCRLKNEMFYGFEKEYPSFEFFSKAIAEYIDDYNNSRIRSKTKWMPPSKFREASMMEA